MHQLQRAPWIHGAVVQRVTEDVGAVVVGVARCRSVVVGVTTMSVPL